MPEEWFVRVQEKEYGPVDLEALQFGDLSFNLG